MTNYLSAKELKNKAKIQLSGQYNGVISACFMAVCLSYLATVCITDLFPTEGLVWFIISLLVNLIIAALTGVFQTGLTYMFLSIACGRPTSRANLFYGFRECYEVSLKISFVHALLQFVCMTPAQILLLIAATSLDTKDIMIAVAAYVIGLVVYIPMYIFISQCYYLILDFPNMTATEALRTSIKLMKKNFGRMLYLWFSFIPLSFLCILTCGIGLLWLTPYQKMTYTYFYLDIMHAKES